MEPLLKRRRPKVRLGNMSQIFREQTNAAFQALCVDGLRYVNEDALNNFQRRIEDKVRSFHQETSCPVEESERWAATADINNAVSLMRASPNAALMKQIKCILTGFTLDETIQPDMHARILARIAELIKIGPPSEYGTALRVELYGNGDSRVPVFVLKVGKEQRNYDDIGHETVVGLTLNELRQQIPNFAYVYGSFACSAPILNARKEIAGFCSRQTGSDDVQYVMYENIENAIPFAKWLQTFREQPGMVLNLALQLFLALGMANLNYDFSHNDAHGDNILVRAVDPKLFPNGVAITYRMPASDRDGQGESQGGEDFIDITIVTKHIPVFIDYGLSSLRFIVDGDNYNQFPTFNAANTARGDGEPTATVGPIDPGMFARGINPFRSNAIVDYQLITREIVYAYRDNEPAHAYFQGLFFEPFKPDSAAELSGEELNKLALQATNIDLDMFDVVRYILERETPESVSYGSQPPIGIPSWETCTECTLKPPPPAIAHRVVAKDLYEARMLERANRGMRPAPIIAMTPATAVASSTDRGHQAIDLATRLYSYLESLGTKFPFSPDERAQILSYLDPLRLIMDTVPESVPEQQRERILGLIAYTVGLIATSDTRT